MEINRRKYLSATVAILGLSSGCLSLNQSDLTMTQEEAKEEFDDVQQFDSPSPSANDCLRMVDSEAGVVVYTLVGGHGIGMTSLPLEETDL